MISPDKYTNDYAQAYINFPITLLRSASDNIKNTCNLIFSFSLFEFSNRSENRSSSFNANRLAAEELYHISYSDDSYAHGKEIDMLYNKSSGFKSTKPPKCGVSTNMLFDFRDNYKTLFEVETFLGFCAIRSILQKQTYFKITKKYVVARMAGLSKSNEYNKAPKNIIKYYTRYHFNKLINEMTLHWGLKVYGEHTNGLYVSFSMSREDLGFIVELNKKKNREKLFKNRNKEENERIKQRVDAKLRTNERTTP